MSVFIIWIYNVDVVTITQRYTDLQKKFGLDRNCQKNRTLFLSAKAFCNGSLANQDYEPWKIKETLGAS